MTHIITATSDILLVSPHESSSPTCTGDDPQHVWQHTVTLLNTILCLYQGDAAKWSRVLFNLFLCTFNGFTSEVSHIYIGCPSALSTSNRIAIVTTGFLYFLKMKYRWNTSWTHSELNMKLECSKELSNTKNPGVLEDHPTSTNKDMVDLLSCGLYPARGYPNIAGFISDT